MPARGDELTVGRAYPARTLRGTVVHPPNFGDTPDFITHNGVDYVRCDVAGAMARKLANITARKKRRAAK